MRSTCPSCLSQVEHAHSESQVTCNSCGEIYSPFLVASEVEAQATAPSAQMPMGDFAESSMAFQEIVDFAQTMDAAPLATGMSGQMASSPIPTTKVSSINDTPQDFILCTSGLGLGYHIQQWFAPLSKICVLGDDQDPLGKALQELKNAGSALGANAIVDIRCALCPDNKRVLVFGTPVRCHKNQ